MRESNPVSGGTVPQLPTVNILVGSNTEHVVESAKMQVYAALNIVYNTNNDGVAKFYNDTVNALKSDKESIFVFLDDGNWLANSSAVSTIVHNMEKFPCAYTDVIRVDGNLKYPEYLPAYSQELILSGRFRVNNSVAISSLVLPNNPFDGRLECLYFMPLLHHMASRYVVCHIAEPLFCVEQPKKNIDKDIRVLQGNE